MSRTVLVTGGAGYIGSHTCKELARAGYEPVSLDNMVYGHEWAVKWGELVKGDIADSDLLDRVLARHRPLAVIHFAAYAYVGESVTDPARYYDNNVAGTLSLLNAMRRAGCHRIIFSSTCATYGMPVQIPITENHPQAPINPYGRTKLMIEQALEDYGRAYGISSVRLRYFNAAGADPEGEVGEDHDPETHLVPLVIAAAQGRRPGVKIFGTDYDTEDGTAVRDYIHVTDLARAHVLAMRRLEAGDPGLVLNLGTEHGHSVRRIVDLVGEISGRPVPAEEAPRRPGDPPRLVASAALARRTLGWTPRYDITDILQTAWDWHTAHTS
jgi:UDP-glucose-4-epimerase GalE